MYICVCAAITDARIDQEIENGNDTLPKLIEVLNVASVCGTCHEEIQEFIERKLETHVNIRPSEIDHLKERDASKGNFLRIVSNKSDL